MAYTVPWHLMGLIVSGDVGDVTIYTDRFQRKVVFPKSPPKKPPSPTQVIRRTQFRNAVKNYMLASQATKEAWEEVARRLSIPMTGQNIWISLSYSQDGDTLATLNHQADADLSLPPAV